MKEKLRNENTKKKTETDAGTTPSIQVKAPPTLLNKELFGCNNNRMESITKTWKQ